jgi:hypothetical protein
MKPVSSWVAWRGYDQQPTHQRCSAYTKHFPFDPASNIAGAINIDEIHVILEEIQASTSPEICYYPAVNRARNPESLGTVYPLEGIVVGA